MNKKSPLPIESFSSAALFKAWLKRNHAESEGVWVRILKKHSSNKSVSYDEALDLALCYGWIDGQKKAYDKDSWLQKFTPRRSRSLWSKRNRDRAGALIRAKEMTSAGLKEVQAAKKDGRWDAAYEGASTMQVPPDFLAELKRDKKAYAFFKTLNRANTYAIAWRLQTAKKPETRQKRKEALLAMLARQEALH
jgi:uncharacterized protein YdeI (YjbR/CyaY-like superfamily)